MVICISRSIETGRNTIKRRTMALKPVYMLIAGSQAHILSAREKCIGSEGDIEPLEHG